MMEILLVAILTLPNTGHVVYEVAGAYPNRRACEVARREQQQQHSGRGRRRRQPTVHLRLGHLRL